MPLSFKRFDEDGYFLANWEGRVGEKELLECYSDFLSGNDSMGHFREFCDLSNVDLSEIQLSGLKALSAVIRDYCERNRITDARCACFVPAEINQTVMALYDTVSRESAEETKVFTNREKALDWLFSPWGQP